MVGHRIDGSMAHSLTEAFEHLGALVTEMNDLRWRICYRPELSVSFEEARTHCRKLIQELEHARYRYDAAKAEDKAEAPK